MRCETGLGKTTQFKKRSAMRGEAGLGQTMYAMCGKASLVKLLTSGQDVCCVVRQVQVKLLGSGRGMRCVVMQVQVKLLEICDAW